MPVKPKAAPPIESSPEAINENLGKRVKKLRGDRGWSLEELATASGVSRSMLSEIEREKANPTLTVTFRIARAFGLTLQELIESAEASASKIQVIRATDRAQVYRSDKQCEIRTLSPINLEKDVEFYEMTLRPGGTLRSQPHFEGTREFLTVEDGSVRIESDQNSEELAKGDSGTYRADVPHAIVNTGKGDALVFLVVIYR
ncbi:MAG: XRE family transcriptional regulator [Prosthecobacter sp.]|uniref:helix-turn-helix domain-containing protein n=1 Tax=Prosthecobacter sp. TaxID=1965333 RepID=UPI0025E74F31|nr:XRE family transcriptional regulator [Prosthecobacter sp.]MCF7786322.1 XRE family transcriptional regulator [Prosthecobacter sp.]